MAKQIRMKVVDTRSRSKMTLPASIWHGFDQDTHNTASQSPAGYDADMEDNLRNLGEIQQAAVRRWVHIRPLYTPPTPSQILGQGASDPFNAAAFPLDATRHAVFLLSRTLYTGYLYPETEQSSPALELEACTAWNEKMSMTISDRLRFHSHLSVVLAFVSRCVCQSNVDPAAYWCPGT
jgi:hypothetical protein